MTDEMSTVERVITQVEYQWGIRRKPPLARGLDEVFRQSF
jgi:hypothetical protein